MCFSEAHRGARFEIIQADHMKTFSLHILTYIICIFHGNCQKPCMGKILALIMWLAFYTGEDDTFVVGICLVFL